MENENDQPLKARAMLLLHRERELLELRMKQERLTSWLKLAQALPQVFADPGLEVGAMYLRLRKTLLDGLKLQKVSFFGIDLSGAEPKLRPLAPGGADRTLPPSALALVVGESAGYVNEPAATETSTLAEAVGLARFIWARIDSKTPVLLVAGYDRAKAKFHGAFDENDAANLRNTAQHIAGNLGNALLAAELRAANETLERRVAERTTQLEGRNHDMRVVLDNVVTAIVTIDASGRLAEERSAKVDEWFGTYEGTPSFADYIATADPAFAELFAMGHEALVEQFLPIELCLEQLPRHIHKRDRVYACAYRVVADSADPRLLLVIDDVTEKLRLVQEEAEHAELLAVFHGLTRDRAGFVTFFEEADRLVRDLADDGIQDVVRRRHLHTLKGNAAMVGAKLFADACHAAEDEIAEEGACGTAAMTRLHERWAALRTTFETVLGKRHDDVVEIPREALAELCRDIARGGSPAAIAAKLEWFGLEPVERPLTRLARHAEVLGGRLGKGDVRVLVETDGSRSDPHRHADLWSALVHLVRNGVDHGLELPAERAARGKCEASRVVLRSARTENDLAIEIEDDGRGIDWASIAEIAMARGLPHGTESELLGALLSEGFSTRETVTTTSGRGLGLAAVNHAVLDLKGTISVQSRLGEGTCWRIVIPALAA